MAYQFQSQAPICRVSRVESIPEEFDVMMVSRFPDSLKAHVFKESKRMLHSRPPTVPWITGAGATVVVYCYITLMCDIAEILHQETEDIDLPGR